MSSPESTYQQLAKEPIVDAPLSERGSRGSRDQNPKTGRLNKSAKQVDYSGRRNGISPFTHCDEYVEVICKGCDKPFKVRVNWDWQEKPKHFYCSEECYLAAFG